LLIWATATSLVKCAAYCCTAFTFNRPFGATQTGKTFSITGLDSHTSPPVQLIAKTVTPIDDDLRIGLAIATVAQGGIKLVDGNIDRKGKQDK